MSLLNDTKQKVILTGFGPFGEVKENPTQKLIELLKNEMQNELYQFFILPVSYEYCSEWSSKNIDSNTSLVVHFGVAANSKLIRIERTAKNLIGSSNDVDGTSGQGKISESDSTIIQTGIDVPELVDSLCSSGMECEVSDDAGDYLCNYIFFKSLQVKSDQVLFVHVPPEKELPLSELKKFTFKLLGNLGYPAE